MNVNCNHPVLAAIFERFRNKHGLTIREMVHDAHIAPRTYEHIKKGLMSD